MRKSDIRYQEIYNSVTDGIFLYDPSQSDLRLVDVNDAVLSMYKYSRKEILELTICDLSDSANGYNQHAAREFAEKAMNGEVIKGEWRAKDKDGRCFWIEVILKSLSKGDGKMLIGIVKDVDNQRNTQNSLLKSQEHFRALTQNSPDVIMRFDRLHRHIFVNDAVVKMVGVDTDLFINKTHREMGIFPDEMCDFWEKHIERVFDSGKSHSVEFIVPGKDPETIVEWRLFPEFDNQKEVESVLAVARDISESKRSQEALKTSEERLLIALEGTSDGLWDWQIGKDEIYFSPRYFTMLGYSPCDFKHDIYVLANLLHPEDKDWVLKSFENAVTEKRSGVELEFRLKRSDRSYAWILSRGKIKYKENGEPDRMVGTHVDISLRKRHENTQNVLIEIANSVNNTRNLDELFLQIQKSLNSVIDTRNCYVALYDENSDTISLPFHKDEKDSFNEFPVGKTITGFVIKTGKSQLVNLDRIAQMEAMGEIEPIGAPSVSWLGVPLRIADKIIGVFVVQSYSEDIIYTEDDVMLLEFVSDQIALAIERKIDQDNLRNNELRLRRIIESSPDGLVVIDMNGRIMDHNSTFPELLKLKGEDILEKNFFDFIADKDVIRVQNVLNETLHLSYSKNFEFRMKRANNTEFFSETSFGLIHGNKNEEGSFVIVIKNIDDRKIYEHNLKIAKEKAEESDRLKTAFLSNMSHEIRTPMNAIIGFSDLLSRFKVTDEEKKEYIRQINFAADTLMRLIDDIIDISKIEAGQLTISPSFFSLAPLFSELRAMFEKSLEQQKKSQIKLTVENSGLSESVQLFADEFRMRQVFSNLLSNAIKFTDWGEISFGIKSLSNGKITFFVRDSGIGISEDKQKYIFERFRQGHENKESFYGGTGLGLAISKNLVEMMGGEIAVFSEVGKGAEFFFSIPYEDRITDVPNIYVKIDRNSWEWSDKTLLVAEDDPPNFFLLRETLKNYSVNILWAKTGKEAVEMFIDHSKSIDLVLMDIQMPEMNGYEATRLIKQINPTVPVIAQTAYAMAGERQATLSAGCDDYISKPIIMNELLFIVNRFFDARFLHR